MRGTNVTGSVVDDSGQPVANARVTTTGKSWSYWENSRTRDDGSFEIAGMRPGNYRVTARRGWDEMRRPGGSDDDVHGEEVVVRPGHDVHVRLVVESQSAAITGQVVDASGAVVSDAYVTAERESDAAGADRSSARRSVRWGSWWKQPALTDMEGNFEIKDLSAGQYTVRAYRQGGGEAFAEGVAAGGRTTLTIKPTGSIVGTVRVPGGAPPQAFSIVVQDRVSGFYRKERFFRSGGAFAMDELPAGKFLVAATAAEGTASQHVVLAQGESKSDVELAVVARVTITAQLVDFVTGKPVRGLNVMASPVKGGGRGYSFYSGGSNKSHISDVSGKVTLRDAPSGRLYLITFPTDYENSSYGWERRLITADAGGTYDAGQIRLVERRTKPRERGGDLGFTLKDNPPDTEPENRALIVAMVRKSGPASGSGLQVGDQIVSVDGHSVRGVDSLAYSNLTSVPQGTTVALGVKRGATVKIVAGKPL